MNPLAGARLSLATLPWLAAVAAAQPPPGPPQERFEEEVEVTEVLLDVLVTDGHGQVIIGLGEDDFVVEEDGEPVEVTGVVFYSSSRLLDSAEELERRGVRLDETVQDRYFILFFQDQKRAAAEDPRAMTRQLRAAREARRWVREELLPRDLVAVASWDHRLKVHLDFTGDREALDRAIAGAGRGADPGDAWPSRRPPEGPLLAALPVGNELRRSTPTIYDALRLLAGAAGAVRGRKNLIFFGRGFGRVENGFYDPEWPVLRPMLETLNDNNVAVYTISMVTADLHHSLWPSLSQLASETGGEYFSNFTSFITPLRRVADSATGYYLLSYRRSRPAGETGFQRVEVKPRNKEFRVQARQGYLYGG